MIHTIILTLLWIGILFCFSASVSLCYRRGWLTRQIKTLELMLVAGREIEKILNKKPNYETTQFLSIWRDFSHSILNCQQPTWKDVFKLSKKRKKKN